MVEIRRFAPGDEKQVSRLINAIMADEFSADQAAYPTDDIDDIPRSYGGLGEAFFVATIDGQIVGTVAIKKEDERIALMRRLFVDRKHRKKQIGVKLIERAVEFCEELGYGEMIFKTTSRMQAAILVCQKMGFVQRAKIELGPIELFRFALAIPNGVKKG